MAAVGVACANLTTVPRRLIGKLTVKRMLRASAARVVQRGCSSTRRTTAPQYQKQISGDNQQGL
jgi:hypothetical protein